MTDPLLLVVERQADQIQHLSSKLADALGTLAAQHAEMMKANAAMLVKPIQVNVDQAAPATIVAPEPQRVNLMELIGQIAPLLPQIQQFIAAMFPPPPAPPPLGVVP